MLAQLGHRRLPARRLSRDAAGLFDARDQDGVPPRRDLQLLRGFAFYKLHRYAEALDLFTELDHVLSTPDSREGLRIARGGRYTGSS